jgi:hypothetical protein
MACALSWTDLSNRSANVGLLACSVCGLTAAVLVARTLSIAADSSATPSVSCFSYALTMLARACSGLTDFAETTSAAALRDLSLSAASTIDCDKRENDSSGIKFLIKVKCALVTEYSHPSDYARVRNHYSGVKESI